jgi:hypothetical protein
METAPIIIFMPVMRPDMAMRTLDDLNKQALLPEAVCVVDNGNNFNPYGYIGPISLMYHNPGENIGTNKVWNMMWSHSFQNFKYVGVLGDDYRLHRNCLRFMLHLIRAGKSKAVTCTIAQGKKAPPMTANFDWRPVPGKGHMGFSLFERDFLLEMPTIPEEFKIFFGDNWIGWWLEAMGERLYEINCPIAHERREDLKEKLDYPAVIKQERGYWKAWLRGEIDI